MDTFKPLTDELFREEVRRARAAGEEGRFREFMRICELNFNWARQLGEMEQKRRYRIARSLDEQGCYGPPIPRV